MDALGLPPPLPSFMADATQAQAPPAPAPAPAGPPTCKNCGKVCGEVLRCSRCKRATYCTAKCAKDDWTFHKRTCEPPKAAKPEEKPAAAAAGGNGGASSPAPAPAPSPSAASSAAASSKDEVELDDEERAIVEEVKKKGYRVHWRSKEDQAQWKEAVGDIKHTKVEASSAPQPVAAGAAAASQASAWNAAGTLETRTLGPWARDRLKQLLREGRRSGDLVVPIPGVGRVVASGISGWGDSSADILIKGGKVKHVYDIAFSSIGELKLDKEMAGEEGDVEMADEGGSAKSGKEGGAGGEEKKEEGSKDKPPRVYLRFGDVSNTSEEDASPGGKGREVRLEFSDNFPAAHKDTVKAALMLANTQEGYTAAVRRAVEQVVQEFKAK